MTARHRVHAVFGGSADNAFMTPDEQWRKLELVVETAQKIWGTPANRL